MIKNTAYFVIASIAYYLFGRFGLTLAIPPGFASAVWPASGVALVCILRFNKTYAALGIGLGSFLLNLGVTSNGYVNISTAAAIPALGISLGAVLQAIFGGVLYQLLLSRDSRLDSPRDIIRFLLIVGPVGCLVAASAGVASLYFNGIIPLESISFSWLTWWIGDTIGVLLFTPMLLILFAGQQQLSNARKLQVMLPATLIYFCVLVVFYASSSTHFQKLTKNIEENSQRFFSLIEERLKISENILRAYHAFYQSSNEVSHEEFILFSSIILSGDSAFKAIGWTEIIPADQRESYEASMRDQGYEDFSFTELNPEGKIIIAPQRDEYYPVLYIYPIETNRRALGLNLAANPIRYQAILQSALKAQPIVTEPLRLAQESADQKGLIMYYPIFRSANTQFNSNSLITDNLHGFISGVIRVHQILQEITNETGQHDFAFSLTDITDPQHPKGLYNSSQERLAAFPPVLKTLVFGGRKFEFSFYPTNHFQLVIKDWNSWIILTVGFLVAALLQALILMITGTTENIRLQVERKTQALQLAKKAAEDASRAKSDFTANISHEIRTPLNAIIGLINMTLKTGLNIQQRDYLKKAKLASTTLKGLINSTLDFSKIEAGKLQIDRTRFDIVEVFSNIQAIFSTQAMERELKFNIYYPQQCPRFLIGDPLRIEQILLNLCSNAIKFTLQGQVELVVNATQLDPSRLRLDLTITDTGIGISEEQQQFLFQAFRQADSSTSRKYGGTGLGLTISKQLIEIMGGSIRFDSEPNKGSQFFVELYLDIPENNQMINAEDFELPLETQLVSPQDYIDVTVDKANSLSRANIETGIEDTPEKLSYISILLVEDVELNQLIAQAMLEEHGASVTLANNGEEALQKLASGDEFDLILMDIQMPVMDGYEATKAIRSLYANNSIPIIAMTANVMNEDVEKCLAAGMDDHIAKPLEETEMLNKILKHLKLSDTSGVP